MGGVIFLELIKVIDVTQPKYGFCDFAFTFKINGYPYYDKSVYSHYDYAVLPGFSDTYSEPTDFPKGGGGNTVMTFNNYIGTYTATKSYRSSTINKYCAIRFCLENDKDGYMGAIISDWSNIIKVSHSGTWSL